MRRDGEVVPPTGRQYPIAFAGQRAVVVQAGAAVREYSVDGTAVFAGFPRHEMALAARGCPLIPWPNRLHLGRYRWDGRDHQVPINEPDKANALHGFTRFMNWNGRYDSDASVTMTLRLLAQDGYPFVLDLSVRYSLGAAGLTVVTSARNAGASAAPYGLGAHPYLAVGDGLVDDALLHLPARTYLPTDSSQIPTGRAPVDGSSYDFRRPRRLGQTQIDHAFTDLDRDSDGRAWLTLEPRGGTHIVRVWVDHHFPYIEVFTADTVPEPERQRRALGVEPMTCPPNAFQTTEGVKRLDPGERFTCSWGVNPTTQ